MLRGLAILGGVALIEQFHFVIYVLGVLLFLAYRILQGVDDVDPDKNFVVRLVRKFFPVTPDDHDGHWFETIDGRRITPIFCAWRRSSPPTSPSRSTRSRPRSRSRATRC